MGSCLLYSYNHAAHRFRLKNYYIQSFLGVPPDILNPASGVIHMAVLELKRPLRNRFRSKQLQIYNSMNTRYTYHGFVPRLPIRLRLSSPFRIGKFPCP
jgi:hypothetical protein